MNTKDFVLIALFAAIVAVFGIFPPLTIPIITVPITAQTMAVMLAGGILGARRGFLAITLFLILIAIGLPLLSGGRGGLGVFLSPSGGFLMGWLIAAFIIGWLIERLWLRLNYFYALISCLFGGIFALYAIGIPWISFVAKIPLSQAFFASLLFVPGDIIKAAFAAFIIVTISKTYPLICAKTN